MSATEPPPQGPAATVPAADGATDAMLPPQPQGVPPAGAASTAAANANTSGDAGEPAPPAAPAPAAAPASAATTADAPPSKGTHAAALLMACVRPFAAAGLDLWLALRLLALRPAYPAHWRTGAAALALLFGLHVSIGLAYDVYAQGLQGAHLELYAVPAASFWALALLLAAAAIAAVRSPATGSAAGAVAAALAAAGFALACLEALASVLLAAAADHLPLVDRYYPLLSWLPLAWTALAYTWAASHLAGGIALPRRAVVVAIAVVAVVSPQWVVDPAARLWVADAGDEADAAEGNEAPQSEQTLYGQFDLLGDALDAIAPAQQGVTELFTISFAGDGRQDVFLNEAVGADAVLAEVFDSGEHGLVLANSVARPQERPFATVSALQRALDEIASRMNLDEDVLALVLTSHGSPDHRLAVALPPYRFDDLEPARLRSLLDEAGIRFRVIIVSACYAGGFIEPLAGPDTMIITASAADQTSFGCRDGAQWTDFGRAYFAEALAQTASFEGAFRLAQTRIAERERTQGLTPSKPQLFVGPGIREQLQRLETRSGGRILFAMARAARHWPHAPALQRRAGAAHGQALGVRAVRHIIEPDKTRKRG